MITMIVCVPVGGALHALVRWHCIYSDRVDATTTAIVDWAPVGAARYLVYACVYSKARPAWLSFLPPPTTTTQPTRLSSRLARSHSLSISRSPSRSLSRNPSRSPSRPNSTVLRPPSRARARARAGGDGVALVAAAYMEGGASAVLSHAQSACASFCVEYMCVCACVHLCVNVTHTKIDAPVPLLSS
jgi:hypothetical protein